MLPYETLYRRGREAVSRQRGLCGSYEAFWLSGRCCREGVVGRESGENEVCGDNGGNAGVGWMDGSEMTQADVLECCLGSFRTYHAPFAGKGVGEDEDLGYFGQSSCSVSLLERKSFLSVL